MLGIITARLLRRHEQLTGESADWLRKMSRVAPKAFRRFLLFVPMSRLVDRVPPEAHAAARIAAMLAEDCGPCLQTTVTLLEHAGIEPRLLRAALRGDTAAMEEKTRTAYLFAAHVVAKDPGSEELRRLIEQWWGKAGTIELALAIASGHVYPAVKRAMGYAQACQGVTVAGEVTLIDSSAPLLYT